MQLILTSETDIGIQRKMSAIEQESFNEKFINSSLPEKADSENRIINNESVKESVIESIDENEDGETKGFINKDDINNSNETINKIISIDKTENNEENKFIINSDQQNINEATDVVTEKNEAEKIKNAINVEVEQNEEKQTDLKSREDKKLNGEQQEKREQQENIDNEENAEKRECEEKHHISEKTESEEKQEALINTDLQDNSNHELDTSMQESNDATAEAKISITDTESENSKEISTDSIGNKNIISIQDEKDDETITINDQEMTDLEKHSEMFLNTESNNVIENKESIEKDNNSDENINSASKGNLTDYNEIKLSEDGAKKTDECLESEHNSNKKKPIENKLPNNKESKKLSLICKLSNTLDILSDEEEEPVQKESRNESSSVEKQCINIDDDDVMLIDEDTSTKDVKDENVIETKVEDHECQDTSLVNSTNKEHIEEKETLDANKEQKSSVNITATELENPKEERKSVENKLIQKPLLPVNFLKSCKKNLADMTRDELEEFCILKIVESVVDRSNLSEIKAQLKIMGQNIEEYKKKAMMLSKQNRDLQVVLKSVQEEQKKKSDVPITPLKITRSVGMQVFMTDKISVRKSSLIGNSQNNLIPNNTPTRLNKSQPNQSPKIQKTQTNANNTQQIPVPRLVPANNTSNNKLQAPSTNIAAKAPVTANLPNGIRNSPPTQKPEKRPHSKMQQGNSVTVDLTDDEPPAKIIQRNVNPPVRLVSPQNLLAPQRQPFGANISSPRKVYIPISGSQNQVRPGQTIMLKTIASPGPRQRLPSILPKNNSNTNTVRMTRINNRHPAPLPDSMKQYQPPNWKDLPPAPELKLSKVENGIVISWKIDGYQEEKHEEIASYQLYAYQETSSPPSTALWKKIGDVKALPLPMACTLTQFMAGYKYYFAVRAVDIRSRLGPFSAPGSILLLNKM